MTVIENPLKQQAIGGNQLVPYAQNQPMVKYVVFPTINTFGTERYEMN